MPVRFTRWLTENALVSAKIRTFLKGQKKGSVVAVGKIPFVLTKLGRTYLYTRKGAPTPRLYRLDWNPDGNVSVYPANLDGRAIGKAVLTGPVKRISDPKPEPMSEAPVRRYTGWVVPTEETLQKEYELEYESKPVLQRLTKNAWPNVENFLDSANQAIKAKSFLVVMPQIDKTIDYRSHTNDKEELIAVLSNYQSWGGTHRNPEKLDAIYTGFQQNAPMKMPIVLKFPNGRLRVFGGNTRMDVAAHLGIAPKVLVIDVPKPARR